MYNSVNFSYILSNFNIKSFDVQKIKEKKSKKSRIIYKVISFDDIFCLKQTYFNVKKILFIYSYLNWLKNWDINIPYLLKSSNNKPFVIYDNKYYILTNWIQGKKLNYDNIFECVNAIKTLGKIHNISNKISFISNPTINYNFINIRKKILNNINELHKIYNLSLITKDNFSNIFIKNYNHILYLANYSYKFSSLINFKSLNKSVCHGDYVNKNIIVNGNSVIPIDFDKACINFSVSDLTYFLKRYLRHSTINWDFEKSLILLNFYNEDNMLYVDEYLYLIASLSFPHKILKISKFYFSNLKNLSNSDKLSLEHNIKKACLQFDFQFKFIDDFENYLKLKFNKLFDE